MSEAYLTNWSFGGETPDTRNHFHATALREARVATEYHEVSATIPARPNLVTRLRLAFARPATSTEACSCPA